MLDAAPSEINRTALALAVLALDPAGMGGIWLRARIGPARSAALAAVTVGFKADGTLALPVLRIHPNIDDAALFGGTDLAATLAAGKHITARGVLASPAALILTMAERCEAGLAARLALHLDKGTSCLIALDEGDGPDETLAPALAERLGLFLDLSTMTLEDAEALALPQDLASARARLAQLQEQGAPHQAVTALVGAAVSLGIASMRAPQLALRAGMAIAALRGLDEVDDTCLRDAAMLCYAHRALEFPAESDAPDTPPDAPPDTPESNTDAAQNPPQPLDAIPQDIIMDAVRAALPQNVLDRLAVARAARAAKGGSGTGARIKGNHRGRPLPARAGRLGGGVRIDIMATLRSAAPMQGLRGAAPRTDGAALRLAIRSSDLRIKRYQHTSDRVLIFAVDASGSSAFARLAEAKGAVELLLASAYARRDHVALIAFRGLGAEVILPPTRSLTATKRRLAGLAGGGGTPLAAGLKLGFEMALQTRARGMTPTLALLTDGRGNIALEGQADRAQAEVDAQSMAQAYRGAGISALIIDIGTRAQPSLAGLARVMGGTYLALPRADAQRLSNVLRAGLGA
jgi:magnesium chelatase subunit D